MNTKKFETKEEKALFSKYIKKVIRKGELGGNKNILIWYLAPDQYWFDYSERGYKAGNFHCSPMEYKKGDGFILPATVTGLRDYVWDGNYSKLDRLVADIIESYNELVEVYQKRKSD